MRQELKAGGKRLLARMPARLHERVLAGHGCIRRRRRQGPTFRRNCALLERSQWWSGSELRAFQAERLRALVAHAYATVPYYRTLFRSLGLTPDDVREVADLERLPFLTKELVRRHFDALVSTRASRFRGHLIGTSGTTGTPLRVYWDHAREAMEAAIVLRHRRWAGFEPGDRIVALRGLDIRVPPGERCYWRFDRAENQLGCSASHMSDETLPYYVRAIRDFRPAIVWGYPSTVHLLAAHLEARGEDLGIPLKGVFLSSEPVVSWQRDVIEKTLGCRVFDWYGLAEGVVSAGECERHEGYHVSEESGLVEIVPSETVPGASEIVATGLDNFMMPLIRYRTGDAAGWTGQRCSCGRGLRLLGGVETKVDDMIVTPDGRWISPSVLTFPFKSVRGIVKSQLVQPSAGELVVRLVVGAEYSARDEVRLVAGLRGRLGDGMAVRVEYPDDIPRTAAGKYRWVISEVRGREAARG